MRSPASGERAVQALRPGHALHSMAADVLAPWVEYAIEAFGVDRCLFASNFPVDGLHGSFDQLYPRTRHHRRPRRRRPRQALRRQRRARLPTVGELTHEDRIRRRTGSGAGLLCAAVTAAPAASAARMSIGNYQVHSDRWNDVAWVWLVNHSAAAAIRVLRHRVLRSDGDHHRRPQRHRCHGPAATATFQNTAYYADGRYTLSVDVVDGVRCFWPGAAVAMSTTWDATSLPGAQSRRRSRRAVSAPGGTNVFNFALEPMKERHMRRHDDTGDHRRRGGARDRRRAPGGRRPVRRIRDERHLRCRTANGPR